MLTVKVFSVLAVNASSVLSATTLYSSAVPVARNTTSAMSPPPAPASVLQEVIVQWPEGTVYEAPLETAVCRRLAGPEQLDGDGELPVCPSVIGTDPAGRSEPGRRGEPEGEHRDDGNTGTTGQAGAHDLSFSSSLALAVRH